MDTSMANFLVTLRTADLPPRQFYRSAHNSASAYDLVATEQGDAVYSITVVPA